MALSVRFVALHSMLYANGKAFPATVGSTVDIAFPDADAVGPDQATRLTIIGTTSDRPVNAGRIGWPPAEMYDTTLSKVIFLVPGSNPASWIDITGAAV
jgi:hypothetical protein